MMVHFRIGAGGAIESAAVESSTLQNPPVEACVVRALRGWRFPKHAEPAEVSYPFVFNPSECDATSFAMPKAGVVPKGVLDLEQLGRDIGALETIEADFRQYPLLLTGATARESWNPECTPALRTCMKVDPARRSYRAIAAACAVTCAGPLDTIEALPEAQRLGQILKRCGANDRVFGGELASYRPRMDPFEYLAVREVVGPIEAELEHDTRPQAQRLLLRLKALLPSIARGLVSERAARH